MKSGRAWRLTKLKLYGSGKIVPCNDVIQRKAKGLAQLVAITGSNSHVWFSHASRQVNDTCPLVAIGNNYTEIYLFKLTLFKSCEACQTIKFVLRDPPNIVPSI